MIIQIIAAVIFHISNRYLNLEPILSNISKELNLHSKICFKSVNPDEALYTSSLVFAISEKPLDYLKDSCWVDTKGDNNKIWTDKYSNIFPYLIINKK